MQFVRSALVVMEQVKARRVQAHCLRAGEVPPVPANGHWLRPDTMHLSVDPSPPPPSPLQLP